MEVVGGGGGCRCGGHELGVSFCCMFLETLRVELVMQDGSAVD